MNDIPVIINGNVVAMLFVGQVRNFSNSPKFDDVCNILLKSCPDFFSEVSREVLAAEYDTMNVMSDDSFAALCRLLERFLPEFIDNGLVSTSKNNLISQLVYYIQKNIDKYIKKG